MTRIRTILVSILCVFALLAIGAVSSALPPPSPPRPTIPTALPVRAAFYYGWDAQRTRYHHAEPYSPADLTFVQHQIAAMQYGNIQAGISSWWGRGTQTDSRLPVQLQAAQGTTFRWTAYYEPEGQGDPTSARIGSDLAYLASHYASNAAWLHVNGKPVIFVFGEANDGCSMVDRWKNAPGRSNWYVVLKVFPGYASCANQPDDWHQYGPASATDVQGTHSFSVSPGFNKNRESAPRLTRDLTRWSQKLAVWINRDRESAPQLTRDLTRWSQKLAVWINRDRESAPRLTRDLTRWSQKLAVWINRDRESAPRLTRDLTRWNQNLAEMVASKADWFNRDRESAPRLTRDLTRWNQNLAAMVASKADWQLITTFNEWGEGTSVENATEWATPSGFGAYLDALHTHPLGSGGPPPRPLANQPPPPRPSGVCDTGIAAPAHYQSVVVFSFENRTTAGVGGPTFSSMPYMNSLATQCSEFSNYTEPNTGDNSATQYVGTLQGSNNNSVSNDCSPSASCQSTQDNIFRQTRVAGIASKQYVEGATSTCSTSGNATKHVPWLYYRGGTDQATCATDVLPYSQFNAASPPVGFSFITPTLCNDGHDCSNGEVDAWAKTNVQAVLNSSAYKAGNVAVFIWYDEDHPVPNIQITPSAKPGPYSQDVNYDSELHAWESMLGLPLLGNTEQGDLRAIGNL